MEKEFMLVKKTTTEEVDGEKTKFTYKPTDEDLAKQVTLTVESKTTAMNLGLPVGFMGDKVFIDIGKTNTQQPLIDKNENKPKKKVEIIADVTE